MLTVVGGGVCWKTLVAIIVMLSILGQCEMSIYPGLRRRPLQPAQSSSYEVNSDFLTQLMEENARRRLQQQFEQHLELINMKLMRQRQREERLRERYRQQQLAAMAAENDDDYDYIRKFKDPTNSNTNPQENSVINNQNNNDNSNTNNNNNNNNVQYEQYDNTNRDFSYKYPAIQNSQTIRDHINFAVNPNDPRYYETEAETDENAGGYMVGNIEASSALQQLRDEDAGAEDDEGIEVDKEEDLDSQVLEEYEEYTPQDDAVNIVNNKITENNNDDPLTMILPPPQQAGAVGQSGNTNFHRIKPQSASAAAAAGVSTGNAKQLQSGVAPARHDMTTLIDKLHPKSDQLPQSLDNVSEGHMVVREHLGIKGEMGMYVVALIAGVSAAATVGLFVLGIAWYTFHNRSKAAADVDYPAYGVTGPNKDISPSGDRKLAQSAQMYHYQHQKQQIIAMENRQNNEENCEMSYVESDDDNEEGDYTVYECPGLAPVWSSDPPTAVQPMFAENTNSQNHSRISNIEDINICKIKNPLRIHITGEMEVKNPLFLDDTPVTPSLGNHPITQVSAQQPSVKKIFEKSQQQQQQSSTAAATTSASATAAAAAGNNVAASSDDKKVKKSKK